MDYLDLMLEPFFPPDYEEYKRYKRMLHLVGLLSALCLVGSLVFFLYQAWGRWESDFWVGYVAGAWLVATGVFTVLVPAVFYGVKLVKFLLNRVRWSDKQQDV